MVHKLYLLYSSMEYYRFKFQCRASADVYVPNLHFNEL